MPVPALRGEWLEMGAIRHLPCFSPMTQSLDIRQYFQPRIQTVEAMFGMAEEDELVGLIAKTNLLKARMGGDNSRGEQVTI